MAQFSILTAGLRIQGESVMRYISFTILNFVTELTTVEYSKTSYVEEYSTIIIFERPSVPAHPIYAYNQMYG